MEKMMYIIHHIKLMVNKNILPYYLELYSWKNMLINMAYIFEKMCVYILRVYNIEIHLIIFFLYLYVLKLLYVTKHTRHREKKKKALSSL